MYNINVGYNYTTSQGTSTILHNEDTEGNFGLFSTLKIEVKKLILVQTIVSEPLFKFEYTIIAYYLA